MPRRWCALLLFVLLSVAGTLFAKDAAKGKYFLYVGTYTDKDSRGIYAYRYDSESGELTSLGLAAPAENPSFLAVDPSGRYLYAVNETGRFKGEVSGAVSAFAIDRETGKLTLLNQVPSKGADPCYISFDNAGKYALVANYTGGSVAVFPLLKDGKLDTAAAFVQHSGASVNKDRQEGPHAHWIETTADNRFAVVADLGLDELLVYRLDEKDGSLKPNDPPFAKLDPGVGPRHVAFLPNGKFAYSVNELGSSVTSFSYDANRGVLKPLATVSTLPQGFSGKNDAAEIHTLGSGKFIYASNRGHDSIAVFAVNEKTGALKAVQDVPTQGKTPRNFTIDPTGTRLLVANQDSGNIVVFRIDEKTGQLTPTGQTLETPQPVSLEFVRVD